jgi:hypothetical protein
LIAVGQLLGLDTQLRQLSFKFVAVLPALLLVHVNLQLQLVGLVLKLGARIFQAVILGGLVHTVFLSQLERIADILEVEILLLDRLLLH